jgi:hypothetical protein
MEPYDNDFERKKITQIKTFISTKAELLDKKVNRWIREEESIACILEIRPFLSYTTIRDIGAYMVGCTVEYLKFVEEEDNESNESN